MTDDPVHEYPQATSARVLAAGFDVLVGLRLLWPDDILVNPHSPGYAKLAEHSFHADWPLGLVLLVCGTIMVVSMRTDRWQAFVSATTWLSLFTWVLVAIDIGRVTFSQMGTIVYLLVAALHGYAYYHMRAWQRQQRRASRQ